MKAVQDTIVPSIQKANQVSKKDGFVLRLQDPDGKQLKRILIFAALMKKGEIDTTTPQSNWLSFVDQHPQAANINTKTFSGYISLNLY